MSLFLLNEVSPYLPYLLLAYAVWAWLYHSNRKALEKQEEWQDRIIARREERLKRFRAEIKLKLAEQAKEDARSNDS